MELSLVVRTGLAGHAVGGVNEYVVAVRKGSFGGQSVDDRPLDVLEKFATIIAIHLNDLPNNQPARKVLRHYAEICELSLIGTKPVAQQRHTRSSICVSLFRCWCLNLFQDTKLRARPLPCRGSRPSTLLTLGRSVQSAILKVTR